MPTITRNSGLRLTVPPTYQVSEIVDSDKSRRKTRAFGPTLFPTDPMAAAPANEALIEALQDQEMQLFDKVQLTSGTASESGATTRSQPPTSHSRAIEFELELDPREDAVLLIERDGMYSWEFATDIESKPPPERPIARGVRQPAAKKRITFRIGAAKTKRVETGMPRRGIVQDWLLDQVKVYVLKFAARVGVGLAVKFLDRNIRKGITRINSLDHTKWNLIDNLASLKLPADRPARILLLIHGAFSSTIGAYGALAGTPWGQKFLEAAWASYDAVIGFDHATLSDDPLANATDLLHGLEGFGWPYPPHFDVIAHSRGGLVFRSLVEQLLPSSKWQARFDRTVFTACPNGGTLLAQPENWHTLIDLYTNLAVAACRLLGMIPQAKAVTVVLKELIQGLGAFVKYCATTAISDGDVPGLAAMQPNGDFIKKINEVQEGQPTPEKSYYCAITSEFEPKILTGDHEPKELPARLVQWIADSFADQLIAEANDLVVNVSSMSAIDPRAGNFIKDRLDFGKNPQVYHTNYFVQPKVINALTKWLQLVEPKPEEFVGRKKSAGAEKPSRTKKRARETERSPQDESSASGLVVRIPTSGKLLTPMGGIVGPELPATVDTDIIVVDADASVKDCLRQISDKAPSYVVIRRDYFGNMLYYALGAEEIVEKTKGALSTDPLISALEFHEGDASAVKSANETMKPLERNTSAPTTSRTVVLDRGQPIGVVPEIAKPHSAADLANMAVMAETPSGDVDRILKTRIMPSLLVLSSSLLRSLGDEYWDVLAPPRYAGAPRDAVAPAITCYFHAEMESEVILKRATSVEVQISREVISAVTGATSADGKGEVDPSRKLTVQVFPKKNFDWIDNDSVEIDPPEPGKPAQIIFDLRPTHEGDGEVLVTAQQGQISLVTLVLKPQIVKTRSASVPRVSAEATTGEAPVPLQPFNLLMIRERYSGNESSYSFWFEAYGIKKMKWDSSKPFKGDREKYVGDLYKTIENKWVSNKDDEQAFAQEMRDFGGQLFDELFPESLQRILWDYRDDIKSIFVISEEPFIPWEIVHLKEPGKPLPSETRFLGQMGLVRWLDAAGWPPDELRIRKGRVRYVIPEYADPQYILPEAQKESCFLEEKFSATEVEAKSVKVRELLQTKGAFDLLHFACHGHAEQGAIWNAGLLMAGRMEQGNYVQDFLTATAAAQNSDLQADDGNRPMVVLNACQIGRAGYNLTGVGGFAQAFLKGGAGAFVGTLWSVGDSPARTFTETLYTQLLKKTRISDAAIIAREAARKAGDATWLAYVVYGHPHAEVSADM